VSNLNGIRAVAAARRISCE